MRICTECREPRNDCDIDEFGVCDDCRRIDEEADMIDEVYERARQEEWQDE